MQKVTRSTTLVNEHGLHARPISKLIEVARRFESPVQVCCAGKRANGRRMLEMLMLAAPVGSVVEFEAEGEDAAQLVAALVALVEAKFTES